MHMEQDCRRVRDYNSFSFLYIYRAGGKVTKSLNSQSTPKFYYESIFKKDIKKMLISIVSEILMDSIYDP